MGKRLDTAKRKYYREYYQKNKEKIRARQRADRAAHPDRYKGYAIMHRLRHPEKIRRSALTSLGRPAPLYDEPRYCEICGDDRGGKHLHSDHDHGTNTWRGWLCGPCNRGLGLLKDNTVVLLNAVEYLRKADGNKIGSSH